MHAILISQYRGNIKLSVSGKPALPLLLFLSMQFEFQTHTHKKKVQSSCFSNSGLNSSDSISPLKCGVVVVTTTIKKPW